MNHSNRIPTATVRPRVWVASLSARGDSLSQWRAYGSESSRIAIGLKPFAGRLGALHSCQLSPATYTEELQNIWLHTLVTYHRCGLRHDRQYPSELLRKQRAEEVFPSLLFHRLMERSACFKDPAFSDEEEWRFVCTDMAGDLLEHSGIVVHYRASGHLIVPYIRMADEHVVRFDDDPPHTYGGVSEDKLPIVDVVIGPQKDQQLAAVGVGEFMKAHGYDVRIRASQVPYRP